MSTIAQIEKALEIVRNADNANTWPISDSDPEVNFLVDAMIDGWEDLDYEDQEIYILEIESL